MYGRKKIPHFVQGSRNSGWKIGITKDTVILATPEGGFSSPLGPANLGNITLRSWSNNLVYWTLDTGSDRVIVKPVGRLRSPARSAYRAWLGMEGNEPQWSREYLAFKINDTDLMVPGIPQPLQPGPYRPIQVNQC